MGTAIERFVRFHKHLQLTEMYAGRNVLEEKLEVSTGYITKTLARKSAMGSDLLERIMRLFPQLNIVWLLTGEGPMFDPQDQPHTDGLTEEHPELNHEDDIPVVPARLFRAPDINTYEYVMNSKSVDRLPPVPHFQKHDMFALCPGDAMAPRICRGYMLALRKMPRESTIINGEIYVVDTQSSGMFLRRLVDNGTSLTFIAENQQDFPDFNIDYSDVINIFRVVGVLITNL